MKKIEKSLAMQEHAKERIPGGCQLLSKRPDMFSWGVWPGYYSKAKGAKVWDIDGNEYLDMSIGGIGATVLGYADDDIDSAVKKAIDNGVASSLNCPEEVELADLLCEIHPWAEMCRFTRTGGEAMSVAVRIARASTDKSKIAFCGYHGWHDWYLAANIGTEDALGKHLLSGLDPRGVPKSLRGTAFPFHYNCISELEEIIEVHGKELGAIVMEPIRSAEPNEGFLQKIREIADSLGAVLIFDEISSGFRLNSGGAHLLYGIKPDIAVFSKAIGNGYSIGAVIGREEVMTAAQDTFISSTNWTERVGFSAAIATINKHRELDVGKHLVELGTRVQTGWRESTEKYNLKVHIGGIPPMSHFAFEYSNGMSLKAYFVQRMIEKGFLASTSFYAMYSHTMENVEDYLESFDIVFKEIADLLESEADIDELLKGKPASSGFTRLT